jgi:hypothetical protein
LFFQVSGDRSSTAGTPQVDQARRSTMTRSVTGPEIAVALDMPISTVPGILTRIGLGRRSQLKPAEPPNRHARCTPGELLHIDVKKLGPIKNGAGHRVSGNRGPRQCARRAGWEYVHIRVDDHSRLTYAEVLEDEKAVTAIGSSSVRWRLTAPGESPFWR